MITQSPGCTVLTLGIISPSTVLNIIFIVWQRTSSCFDKHNVKNTSWQTRNVHNGYPFLLYCCLSPSLYFCLTLCVSILLSVRVYFSPVPLTLFLYRHIHVISILSINLFIFPSNASIFQPISFSLSPTLFISQILVTLTTI